MSALLQVLGAVSIVYFARVALSERGKDTYALLAATLGVALVSLFVGWPAHAAAGMLLGLLFPLAFSRRISPFPMLAALACAAAFAIAGAGWVIIPAGVAAVLWLVSGNGLTALGQLLGRSSLTDPAMHAPDALPEQAGGFPFLRRGQPQPEPVPAQQNTASQPKAQAQAATPGDALSQLHHETRLPAAIRAQLVALDQRTAEGLNLLGTQGNTASEAQYQLRAIREEYAPDSVRAYLNLPPNQANTVPLENGKTGRDLLAEQLDLLLDAAQRILDNVTRSSGQDLLSNGRFLRDKFGGPDEKIKV